MKDILYSDGSGLTWSDFSELLGGSWDDSKKWPTGGGDLMIADGDLVVGESDTQHIKHIILTNPGDWKKDPETGGAIRRQINRIDNKIYRRKLKIQLEADGWNLNQVKIENN